MFLKDIFQLLLLEKQVPLETIARQTGVTDEQARRGLEILGKYLPDFGTLDEKERVFRRVNFNPPRIHDAKLAQIAHDMGLAWKECGDTDGAMELFQYAAELNPDSPRSALTSFQMGLLALEGGDVEGAARYLVEALEVDPSIPEAWEALGRVYFQNGDVERAIGCFLQEVAYNSSTPTAWYWLGVARLAGKDYPGAVRALKFATENDPECAPAWYKLALALALAGMAEEAGASLARCVDVGGEKYLEMAQSESAFEGVRENGQYQALFTPRF
ncbi:MAG: tetratricopeptide repeat protein [Promethearchaeota archaeon]